MSENNLGKKVKLAIKKLGLTQKEFEKKIGISNNLISRWCNGSRNPSISNLKKIAQATDMPLEYFLENEKNFQRKKTENSDKDLIIKLIEEKDNALKEKIKNCELEINYLKEKIVKLEDKNKE